MSELGSPSSVDTPPPSSTTTTTHNAATSAPSSDPPQKRRKVDLACDECRARKVKCDGTRPVCDVCQRRKNKGAVCTYTTNPFRPQPTGLNVGSSPSGGPARRHTPPIGREQHHQQQPLQRGYERPIQQTPTPAPCEDSNSQDHSDLQHKSNNSHDGRVADTPKAVTGRAQTHSDQQEFFGNDSAGSFIYQIKSAIDEKLGINGQRPQVRSSLSSLPLSRTGTPGQRANSSSELSSSAYSYVLPSRRKADSLLGIYWAVVDPLYPFLDKKRFADFYKSLWEGKLPRTEEKVFVATLNVVFALSSQLSDNVEPIEREQDAKEYFQRAQNMIQLDIWDIGSIELIQCLLLMGQYLQSTSTPHQCCMVVGHAVRVAQGLGLHLPDLSADLQDRRERELARRIWHACVMMDRVLSMTMGRPAIVSKAVANAVPLPEMIDMDYLHLKSQPADTPAVAEFYVRNLRLYDVVNDILLKFYNTGDDDKKKGREHFRFSGDTANPIDFATVLELDEALTAWSKGLSPHLQYPLKETSKGPSIFRRQAIVSRGRFLYTKILLFRPILSQFCVLKDRKSSLMPEDSIAGRMALHCSGLCLRAAQDLINLIHVHFDTDAYTGPLPSWWYCILYIYTSATVLLAARIQPLISSAVLSTTESQSNKSSDGYSIDRSWARARSLLRSFESFGPSAQRYMAALDVLDASLAKKYSWSDKKSKQSSSPVRYGPIVLRHSDQKGGTSSPHTSTNQSGLSLSKLADAAVASGASTNGVNPTTADLAAAADFNNSASITSKSHSVEDDHQPMEIDMDWLDMSWLSIMPAYL